MSTEDLGKEPFDLFSDEDLQELLADMERPKKSRNVCSCGHSINAHSEVGGRHLCTPGRIYCRCAYPNPVLEAENLRLFMYTTDGLGTGHALSRGLYASKMRNSSTRWLNNPAVCDNCSKELDGIHPVSINTAVPESPRIVRESGHVNKLLCKECYDKWTTLAV